ncbi:restriction endonuclease subunit S [Streptomyces canus]|uniref:restriction endonuclease subunit S n=1 Tax=Streptomyces canus TaxID=58343 RepID=UPI0038709062|nr:restriction endonuclease subunit S [Streptomyces canus]
MTVEVSIGTPEDWKAARLRDVATFASGTTPSRARQDEYFNSGKHLWVKTLDLNNSVITTTEERVTDRALEETTLKIHPAGTVLVAMYGGYQQIGRTGLLAAPAAVNQALTAVMTNPRKLVPAYLLHTLNYRIGYWRSVASSSRKDPNITGSDVKDFPISLPQVSEQEAIAEAVSDIDQLIAVLERAIAKRNAIKQGMLQQLLTGKTHLSGWSHSRLSELIDGLEAGVSVRSSKYASHGVAVLKTSAVDRGRFDPTEAKSVFPADIGRVRCNPVAGSLIISRMNTPALVGEVGYVEHDYTNLYLPDRLWLARPKRGGRWQTNMRWLGYYLSSESGSRGVRELATGTSGSMKNIPKDRLLALKVPTPPPLEQDRIAEAVRDADRAIDLLRDRLSKARGVKQGMMQQLLTGRTRFPVEEGAA